MASHLAHIFGTEQDRVNCSFYLKIGACRHGDRCSRKHIKPQYSQTILLPNVYSNPAHTPQGAHMSAAELQANFDAFYEDMYIELCKYGHLQEMHVCDNIGDHLMGNVYARYDFETESAKALENLNDRWYAMRPLLCELSPVSDFRESCCRQNEMGECKREGFCNFMHLCHPTPALVKSLQASQRLSRRNAAAEAAADGAQNSGNLGWVPGGNKGGSGGGASWQPRDSSGGGGGGNGDAWQPRR